MKKTTTKSDGFFFLSKSSYNIYQFIIPTVAVCGNVLTLFIYEAGREQERVHADLTGNHVVAYVVSDHETLLR